MDFTNRSGSLYEHRELQIPVFEFKYKLQKQIHHHQIKQTTILHRSSNKNSN